MVLDFFAVIHEFAVLGTTFFIMALATLWYSPLLFGAVWVRVSGSGAAVFDETSSGFVRQIVLACIGYTVEVGVIAWLLAYAPTVALHPQHVGVLLVAFVAALTLPPTIFEGKPWQYYAVHTGFMVVVICVSVASLTYWPW